MHKKKSDKKENIKVWDLRSTCCSSSTCCLKLARCLPSTCCSQSTCCLPSNCCSKMPCCETFDAFLICVKSRITEKEIKIAEKVSKKLGKPFVFICTKADTEKKADDEEEALLNEMETDYESVQGLVEDKSDIYVIHNESIAKNELERLRKDIVSKLVKRRKDCFLLSLNFAIYATTKKTRELYIEAQKQDVAHMQRFYSNDFIPLWMNTEINLAITGNSGAGKSSFINAVRG